MKQVKLVIWNEPPQQETEIRLRLRESDSRDGEVMVVAVDAKGNPLPSSRLVAIGPQGLRRYSGIREVDLPLDAGGRLVVVTEE